MSQSASSHETPGTPNPNSGSVPTLTAAPLVDPSRASGAAASVSRSGNGSAPDGANGAGTPGPALGIVEMDRYCDHCGFNLHGQQVFRDEHTGLVVARCPECGRFHAASLSSIAGVVWLKRFTSVVVLLWIAAIVFFFVMTTIALTGIQVGVLDEITSQVRTGPQTSQRALDSLADIEVAFMLTFMGVTALVGFLQVFLLTVTAHHWRRWGYFAAAVFFPAIPLAIVSFAWWRESPDSFSDVIWVMLVMCGSAIGGALIAAALGRIIARLLAIGLIPPRPRQALAFLWLADGKPPPSVKGRRG